MSEVMKRTLAGAGSVAGTAIAPAVALGLAALGIPPTAAAAFASVLGVTVEQLGDYAGSLWADDLRRTHRFAETATTASGLSFEEILQEALEDESLRDLLRASCEAARQSTDDRKIDALASLLASGAVDHDNIETSQVLVDVLRTIQRLDLRLLAILERPNPHAKIMGDVPNSVWPTQRILEEDHNLAPVLSLITARLTAIGVVRPFAGRIEPQAEWQLTELGRACVSALRLRNLPAA